MSTVVQDYDFNHPKRAFPNRSDIKAAKLSDKQGNLYRKADTDKHFSSKWVNEQLKRHKSDTEDSKEPTEVALFWTARNPDLEWTDVPDLDRPVFVLSDETRWRVLEANVRVHSKSSRIGWLVAKPLVIGVNSDGQD